MVYSDARRIIEEIHGYAVVFLTDGEKTLSMLEYSDNVPEHFGFSIEEYAEIRNNDSVSQIFQNDIETVMKGVKAAVEGKSFSEYTARFLHKTDGYIWIRCNAVYEGSYPEGHLIKVVFSNIEKETEIFKNILDNTDRLVFVVENDTKEFLYANKEFCRWAGIEDRKYIGLKCFDYVCKNNDSRKCDIFHPLLSADTEENEIYDSCSNRFFKTESNKVDWCGRDARVVFLSDITDQIQQSDRLKLSYKYHLDAIMRISSDAISTFKINLTEGMCLEGSGKFRVPQYNSYKSGSYDNFIRGALKYILNENERKAFYDTFTAENLLEKYSKGTRSVSLEHSYMIDDVNVRLLRTTVEVFGNPITKDIEAVMYSVDISENYLRKSMMNLLLKDDYQAITMIDCTTGRLQIIDVYSESRLFKKDFNDHYDNVRKTLLKHCIDGIDREIYLENSELSYIKKQLKKSESFHFVVKHSGELSLPGLKRYTFKYISDDERFMLMAVSDVNDVYESDTVTGGINRAGFIRRATEILETSSENDEYAIMFYNILGFKAINELFGVELGDRVIKQIYKILKESEISPLLICRSDADHFLCLIDKKNLDYDKLEKLSHGTFSNGGREFNFSGQFGVYIIEEKSLNINSMCDKAKIANESILYNSTLSYAIFESSMAENYLEEKELISELKYAIMRNDFTVSIQPIYDAKTGTIASAEALIRWNHPVYGSVSPARFIPVLEKNGYISRADYYVLNKILQMQEKRYEDGRHTVPVSVNLSRADFFDNKIMGEIDDKVRNISIPLNLMRIEIAETAYATISQEGRDFMESMKELGVKVLIDDFGTGYSSLNTIKDYEFNILKLDMGFIRSIAEDRRVRNIVRAVINLAHDLEMEVTAEGVETLEQLEYLKEFGCDYIQGYYYSKPLTMYQFEELLDNSSCPNMN